MTSLGNTKWLLNSHLIYVCDNMMNLANENAISISRNMLILLIKTNSCCAIVILLLLGSSLTHCDDLNDLVLYRNV